MVAVCALVLGLLQPLSLPAAAEPNAVPGWAQQGDVTSFLDVSEGDTAERYVLHRYLDPNTVYDGFAVPPFVTDVEYLVVGGGGGGGERGGGGGAGGMLEGLSGDAQAVRAGQVLAVTVGAGGGPGASGSNSMFDDVVALGGGHGGNAGSVASGERGGAMGGSGGGGGHYGAEATSGGAGADGQGSIGGGNAGITDSPWPAGGGGGAGAAGADAAGAADARKAGDGGDGRVSTITGVATYYAGGGGGQVLASTSSTETSGTGGTGGRGGGGTGGNPVGSTEGKANTGGGGGGGDTRIADLDTNAGPQRGGSGIVVLRYPADDLVHVDSLEASDATVTVGRESTLTATVVDIDGAPVAEIAVALEPGHGADPNPATTDAEGRATFTVTHDTAESVTYTTVIDGVAMGTVDVTYTAWQPPAPDGQGAFKVSSYAGSEIGETASRWWRGYVFTVAEETTVTHLVGSGTQWSTVGLFEAAVTGSGDATEYSAAVQDDDAWQASGNTNADNLDALALGWALIEGDVTDEPKVLDAPVTLRPGTRYLLAQSAAKLDGSYEEDGHNRYVDSIDRDDLLSHARIGDIWLPEVDDSLRWDGSDAETIAGAHRDSDGLMPLVGFLYDSDASEPVVTTTDPATEPFAGTLTDTGGSATTVCIDVGESQTDYERRCVDTVDVGATDEDATVDFALDSGDLAGFTSGTLSYRAVGVNEVGVQVGAWTSAYHAAGTLIVEESFSDRPADEAGWVFERGENDTERELFPSGVERLRLTTADDGAQAGTAIYDRAQPTAAGLDVTFRMQQHGGTSAGDGMSFFLVDGETTDIEPGDSGGRLGYVNLSGQGGAGALIGIGFDTYGNFPFEGGTDEADCTDYGDTTRTTDVLAIRGGPADDWCLLSEPVNDTTQTDWSQVRTVRVVVDAGDETDPELRVFIDGATEPILSVAQPAALGGVESFKFGFSASTGSATNNHDVWDVDVRSLTALPAVAWVTDSPLPSAVYDQDYELALAVDNAVAPETINHLGGDLPPGLELAGQAITGTPTQAGEFTFTLQVADSREPPSTASREFTLTVAAVAPAVGTTEVSVASDEPATAVSASGAVNDDGGTTIDERGFVYAEVDAGAPTYEDNVGRVEAGAGSGTFTARIDDLRPNTTYAVRAYARNADGTAYGDTLEVTTERQSLTLSDVTVEDRPYDGTTEATVTDYGLDGVSEGLGDVHVVDVVAVFVDANAGERAAEVTGAELTGGDAERYELTLDPVPTATGTIRPAEATLSFVAGLAWPAFDEGEQATTAPRVAVDPATDAADSQDPLDASVALTYGPDDDPSTTQPSQVGSYRVTATLDHPNYETEAVHSTVVVIPPEDDDQDAPLVGPVPDHDEEGEPQPPTRDPSTATVTEDGVDIDDVTVTGSQGGPLVVTPQGDGFRVALDARQRSGGPPTGIDAEERLRLTVGRFLHASGVGFGTGSRVEVWLFSEPHFLGTATVDANGEFDAEFSVPADLQPGEHTVQLNGYGNDGALRSTSVGLLVDPAPAARPTPSPEEPDAQATAWLDEALDGLSDVAAGDPHAAGISLTVWAGITVGYSDGTFRPDQPTTRGQSASLLAGAFELTAEGPAPFSDVPEGSTHAEAIAAIAAADIAIGYADGTFRPDQPISRGQFAALVSSAFELTAEGPAPFSDVPEGSTHAEAIAAIAAADIAIGYADGTFRPHQSISRGQSASLLSSALDLESAILDAAIAVAAAEELSAQFRLREMPSFGVDRETGVLHLVLDPEISSAGGSGAGQLDRGTARR